MKKKMLTIIALLLAFLLLTACGGNVKGETDDRETTGETTGGGGGTATMIECDACGGSGQNCDRCTDGICAYCGGEGQKACTICNGTGECGLCKGSGKGTSGRTCYTCYGSGACNGSYCNNGYDTCATCDGTGVCGDCGGERTCSKCSGAGQIEKQTETEVAKPQTCPNCNGVGCKYCDDICVMCGKKGCHLECMDPCSTCDGMGEIDCSSYNCNAGSCVKCNGLGYTDKYKDREHIKVDCTYCNGTGECQQCDGKVSWGKVDCPDC